VADTILDLAIARQARAERKARESRQPEPQHQPNPLLDPANLDDPYPAYARLRKRTPVWRIPDSQGSGQWLVSRYAEVQRVLADPRCSAERQRSPGGPPIGGSGFARTMLSSDPPEHTRLRSLVSQAFTPRRIASLRGRIEQIADELLVPALGERQIELMSQLARPLPAIVIGELLGVPAKDRAQFRTWAGQLLSRNDARSSGELGAAMSAIGSLGVYLAGLIQERRREPADDLISAMLTAREGRDAFGEMELLSMLLLLLIAGYETTTNLIGNGVLALLRHPREIERLREDRSLLPTAVDELLRFDSPVQATARVAREELELAGERIPKGALVQVLLGSANRDPVRFEDPDRLDVGRANNEHLSFGWGVHYCLGAPLARLEAQIALDMLIDRFPRWRLGDEGFERKPNPFTRGLAKLSLRVR
jgi:pimeloyl-[acyl-carrier protein] synthase